MVKRKKSQAKSRFEKEWAGSLDDPQGHDAWKRNNQIDSAIRQLVYATVRYGRNWRAVRDEDYFVFTDNVNEAIARLTRRRR